MPLEYWSRAGAATCSVRSLWNTLLCLASHDLQRDLVPFPAAAACQLHQSGAKFISGASVYSLARGSFDPLWTLLVRRRCPLKVTQTGLRTWVSNDNQLIRLCIYQCVTASVHQNAQLYQVPKVVVDWLRMKRCLQADSCSFVKKLTAIHWTQRILYRVHMCSH
jgi:hypothetical protein